jgi:hypothetical protein
MSALVGSPSDDANSVFDDHLPILVESGCKRPMEEVESSIPASEVESKNCRLGDVDVTATDVLPPLEPLRRTSYPKGDDSYHKDDSRHCCCVLDANKPSANIICLDQQCIWYQALDSLEDPKSTSDCR